MQRQSLEHLLGAVQRREVSVDEAMVRLRHLPFETIDAARIDHHRAIRCGFPEVIYCEGKTTDDVVAIFQKLVSTGDNVLATRASAEQADAVCNQITDAEYHRVSRCITCRQSPAQPTKRKILLLAAGTSDRPVLEEARVTCEIMDQTTQSICDIGVAGLPRLLANAPILQAARVIVVAAGMDGALPGVVSGMVEAPVIAVPTSIGYGAHFNGLAPLLTMLNACAPGVAVVNIDNGFAAGYLASMINRSGEMPKD